MAMRDVGLTFPIYMTVRNSGDALVTIATTLDPSDADWQQASAIVCQIIQEKVGCGRLRRTRIALRYCERRGDKCRRCDGRLISEFDTNAGRLAFDGFRIPLSSGSYRATAWFFRSGFSRVNVVQNVPAGDLAISN